MIPTDVEQRLRELEEALLQPALRRDSEALSSLLADECREFGSSGRIYNKQEIVAALQTEPATEFTIADFRVNVLAEGIALVTYRATEPTPQVRVSLRSSLWVMREGRWRLLFHQGTQAPSL